MANYFPGKLGENTIWALSGYGMRLLIQAVYFVIIARCLGPEQYGGFVAATALTAVISPFVGLGTGSLLVKNVARDPEVFCEYWGNGLFLTLVSGVLFTGLVLAAGVVALPRGTPLSVVFLISVSDLILVKLLDMAAWAFQAFEHLNRNAQLNVMISLSRLIGIGALAVAMPHPTVKAWAAVYLAGSVLAGVAGIVWATLKLGTPKLALGRIRGECVEGFHFSVSFSAQTIYNDIDKTMVARLSTLGAAGIYAVAYRIIDVAFTPVRALLNAAYPSFFRHGQDGLQAGVQFGRRLLLRTLPYPLFAFVILIAGASLLPHVLGEGFRQSTEALRWLAPLPLLKTVHYFISDSLTGSGFQGTRTAAQAGVALFNIALNFALIPSFGWRGAAWASLASDGLLVVVLWCAAEILLSRRRSGLRISEDLA
ncbi:MAG TPA: oligosaccharide flippase family protein [Candidatus Acidoferrales bacterium]|nr:oligosaccharide flippase family protein [Candidatus Acidoferrales bacterium]